jgi:hypothetical protein
MEEGEEMWPKANKNSIGIGKGRASALDKPFFRPTNGCGQMEVEEKGMGLGWTVSGGSARIERNGKKWKWIVGRIGLTHPPADLKCEPEKKGRKKIEWR